MEPGRTQTTTLALLLVASLAHWLATNLAGPVEAQVIRLRHPEAARPAAAAAAAPPPPQPQPQPLPPRLAAAWSASHTNRTSKQLPSAPTRHVVSHRPRARPGHAVVHFGRDHEIQKVEYILKDGSLATIYSRDDNNNNSSKSAPQAASTKAPDISINTARQDDRADHYEPQDSGAHSTATVNLDDGNEDEEEAAASSSEGPKSETGQILGHMASDALQAGLAPNRPANLIARIKGKLAKLPNVIQARLLAKSRHGKTYVDPAPGERAPIGEGSLPEGSPVRLQEALASMANARQGFGEPN